MVGGNGGSASYDLFQIDILKRLVDRDWFALCAESYYGRVAVEWGCRVDLSERRLQEACDFWLDDVERTVNHGFAEGAARGDMNRSGSTELDHFKHASILAFWLRRLVPINSSDPIFDQKKDVDWQPSDLGKEQMHFLRYGNELCALLFGFTIALNYHYQVAEERAVRNGLTFDHAKRIGAIKEIRLPYRFVFEYPQLLKHKNFSWHALYMVYRSMFEKFERVL